jgi:hypothetical protein
MNKDQKGFLKALLIVGYCFIGMFLSLNALFSHDTLAELAPLIFIVIGIVFVFIKLGGKSNV